MTTESKKLTEKCIIVSHFHSLYDLQHNLEVANSYKFVRFYSYIIVRFLFAPVTLGLRHGKG